MSRGLGDVYKRQEEEIEYKESLFDLVKDDAAVLSYAIHYLDDWLPDSAE